MRKECGSYTPDAREHRRDEHETFRLLRRNRLDYCSEPVRCYQPRLASAFCSLIARVSHSNTTQARPSPINYQCVKGSQGVAFTMSSRHMDVC
jgi:hypothetical protein